MLAIPLLQFLLFCRRSCLIPQLQSQGDIIFPSDAAKVNLFLKFALLFHVLLCPFFLGCFLCSVTISEDAGKDLSQKTTSQFALLPHCLPLNLLQSLALFHVLRIPRCSSCFPVPGTILPYGKRKNLLCFCLGGAFNPESTAGTSHLLMVSQSLYAHQSYFPYPVWHV